MLLGMSGTGKTRLLAGNAAGRPVTGIPCTGWFTLAVAVIVLPDPVAETMAPGSLRGHR
ncbi:hypothetical protein AB4039_04400 [Streptomyces sp. M-16]|uniref:hypothetical protein n=1 Tax=Streptomyces sp. M-16 TaxID=3233040 RepID=UPI00224D865F